MMLLKCNREQHYRYQMIFSMICMGCHHQITKLLSKMLTPNATAKQRTLRGMATMNKMEMKTMVMVMVMVMVDSEKVKRNCHQKMEVILAKTPTATTRVTQKRRPTAKQVVVVQKRMAMKKTMMKKTVRTKMRMRTMRRKTTTKMTMVEMRMRKM
uniref:Uncharacterized protein n=2 Tax=Cannabis sativa TaxID=3483 RepID=A0A803R074_CANSA